MEGLQIRMFLVFLAQRCICVCVCVFTCTYICKGGGRLRFDKPGELLASHTEHLKIRAIIITGACVMFCVMLAGSVSLKN